MGNVLCRFLGGDDCVHIGFCRCEQHMTLTDEEKRKLAECSCLKRPKDKDK